MSTSRRWLSQSVRLVVLIYISCSMSLLLFGPSTSFKTANKWIYIVLRSKWDANIVRSDSKRICFNTEQVVRICFISKKVGELLPFSKKYESNLAPFNIESELRIHIDSALTLAELNCNLSYLFAHFQNWIALLSLCDVFSSSSSSSVPLPSPPPITEIYPVT